MYPASTKTSWWRRDHEVMQVRLFQGRGRSDAPLPSSGGGQTKRAFRSFGQRASSNGTPEGWPLSRVPSTSPPHPTFTNISICFSHTIKNLYLCEPRAKLIMDIKETKEQKVSEKTSFVFVTISLRSDQKKAAVNKGIRQTNQNHNCDSSRRLPLPPSLPPPSFPPPPPAT